MQGGPVNARPAVVHPPTFQRGIDRPSPVPTSINVVVRANINRSIAVGRDLSQNDTIAAPCIYNEITRSTLQTPEFQSRQVRLRHEFYERLLGGLSPVGRQLLGLSYKRSLNGNTYAHVSSVLR